MKYILLLGDGMADRPLDEYGGKTPLEISSTPCMDSLAARGTLGMVNTIPDGYEPGSDVANMCVLGYNPQLHYTGRAPIEAVSMGILLEDTDIAYRCNLVSFANNGDTTVMDDYSAGHIPTEEAHRFIAVLKKTLDSPECRLHPGISYRHVLIVKQGDPGVKTCAPHDISGREVAAFLPSGNGSELIRDLMSRSRTLLNNHQLNRERCARALKPVSSIWLWGQGKAVNLPSFHKKYALDGSVISAVDLIKGLGISAGLNSIDVPGATGYLDTNYAGKVAAALGALATRDFVYLHVEAPDEASHKGSLPEKIRAIEEFDSNIVAPVLEGLRRLSEPYRILVLPDHPTPLAIKTHSSEPVPFILYDSTKLPAQPLKRAYCEQDARATGVTVLQGWTLMDTFIRQK